MEKLIGILIIICMTLISKFLRMLAFGRADSIALEVSICAFIYNLLYAITYSESLVFFLHNELLRCITLLLFAFVIAIVHHYYKSICMQKINKIVDQLTNKLDMMGTESEMYYFEKTMLEHIEIICQQAIDVWYSESVDNLLKKFIKKTGRPEDESLRKKKSIVRWAFVDILNSMDVLEKSDAKLIDTDLNIEIANQNMGMIIFDTMEFLSIIVAIRII